MKQTINSFEKITVRESGMRGSVEFELLSKGDSASVTMYMIRYENGSDVRVEDRSVTRPVEEILRLLSFCDVLSWDGFNGPHPKDLLDGIMFRLEGVVENRRISASGSENFPKHYREFMSAVYDILNGKAARLPEPGGKLFIYYSNTGNCEAVAEKLKASGFETRKAVPVKDLPKVFFFKILSGGFQAGLKKKAKLRDYDNDVSDYDTVVIGSPVWNGMLSTPINTVLDATDLAGKDLTFILCAGGGEAPKAEALLKQKHPDANVIVLKEPKSNAAELEKLPF